MKKVESEDETPKSDRAEIKRIFGLRGQFIKGMQDPQRAELANHLDNLLDKAENIDAVSAELKNAVYELKFQVNKLKTKATTMKGLKKVLIAIRNKLAENSDQTLIKQNARFGTANTAQQTAVKDAAERVVKKRVNSLMQNKKLAKMKSGLGDVVPTPGPDAPPPPPALKTEK